jgi:hypothetical protein
VLCPGMRTTNGAIGVSSVDACVCRDRALVIGVNAYFRAGCEWEGGPCAGRWGWSLQLWVTEVLGLG